MRLASRGESLRVRCLLLLRCPHCISGAPDQKSGVWLKGRSRQMFASARGDSDSLFQARAEKFWERLETRSFYKVVLQIQV